MFILFSTCRRRGRPARAWIMSLACGCSIAVARRAMCFVAQRPCYSRGELASRQLQDRRVQLDFEHGIFDLESPLLWCKDSEDALEAARDDFGCDMR